jgi:molecular chaperone GrpE
MTSADTPSGQTESGRVVDARPGAQPPPAAAAAATPDPEPEPVVEAEAPEPTAPEPAPTPSVTDPVEDLEQAAEVVEADLSSLAGERDQYLDQLRRVQADFENYRKRVLKQQDEVAERATEGLVADLLPVLDACDAAAQHGDDAAGPIAKALMDVLGKQGLTKVAPEGEPFDPNQHEAVAHEPGDGDPTVAEVLRAGYVWKGRVLRPAMVRVQG